MTGIDCYAKDLKHRSGEFLTDLVRDMCVAPEMVLFRCSYHLERFDVGLYDSLNVDFPKQLHSAVNTRLAEFLAGRALSKAALSALGVEGAQIYVGNDRAPIWPTLASGSISHSWGRCAVIVSANRHSCVGIDIERLAKGDTLDAILKTCLSDGERSLLARQDDYSISQMATLIFSAKETLFKMIYPSVRKFFGFESAVMQHEINGHLLSLLLKQDLPGGFLAGSTFDIHFETNNEYVLTWASLEEAGLAP